MNDPKMHIEIPDESLPVAMVLARYKADLAAAGEREKRLRAAANDAILWINRRLEMLEHRQTGEVYAGCTSGLNGFAFSAVPDWELKQKREMFTEALS